MSGIEKLKSAAVKNAKPALSKKTGAPRETMLSDGGGLYLVISSKGSKSWALIWSDDGKRRQMGLGSYKTVSLEQARIFAKAARSQIGAGLNPITERKRKKAHRFEHAAKALIEVKGKNWKHEKHIEQWHRTIYHFCKPILETDVKEITKQDILGILNPIWETKQETARRVRSRIENVLDFATASGWREGDNPARWKGNLEHLLSKQGKRGNFAALDYTDIPEFMEKLRAKDTMAARALELTILCATRTMETIGSVWTEFDLDSAVWTIPAERMKMGKAHSIPLSDRAIAILKPFYDNRRNDGPVFTNRAGTKALSNMAMLTALKRMTDKPATVHGMRAAFKSYSLDKTNFEWIVSEFALAHQIPDTTEAAYARTTAYEKRVHLMRQWSEYCSGESSTVISIHGASEALK